MKTPIIVGRYRFKIAWNMLAGQLTLAQAENLQRMTDGEIMRILMQNQVIQ